MKSNDRPTRVLEAASRLIAHYGFDKTTMDDIAREAGVSKGALYLEWQGKEQLFHALLTYEMKRLLADFQQRMEQDPQGGRIANLYRHALLALQANPLMRALYTRDSRVLGDFVRRQDSQRYTGRFLLAEEGVQQMQAAGLLRADLRPEVIAYLFSVIAVGFIYIGSILPDTAQIPLEDITTALADVIQRGLAGPGDDSAAGKQAMEKLGAFVRQQYDKEGEA